MHLGLSRSRFSTHKTPSRSTQTQLPGMAKRTASYSQIKPISLKSKQTQQQGTFIFLHGLGDTGYGWLQIMEILHRKTPHIKYILPTAPSRPVTINGGEPMPAWYDIKSLSEKSRSDPLDGLSETVKSISELIEEEIGNGIPSHRIMLGGFSQGGASAMYIGYTYPRKLAGLLILSAYLPQRDEFFERVTDCNKQTEFLMCHGENDSVIPLDWGKKSYDQLISSGRSGVFKSYSGMAHEASNKEIEDVLEFVLRIFGSPLSSKL